MLKLIIYQFRYSKKEWLGTVPLLFVSSIIVGTSLIGITSASSSAVTSIQLFQMLIFFGGMTLFFLVSNIIKFLLDIFKKDYQLWTILGASKSQLSVLIAGQFYLMAMITSLVGTLFSFIITEKYYHFLQNFLGHRDLPDLIVKANFQTILLSIFIVPTIVGLSAFFYSRQILAKYNTSSMIGNKNTIRFILSQIFIITICLSIWGMCVSSLMADVSSKSADNILQQTGSILIILLIHLIIIQVLSPFIQTYLVKLFIKIFGSSTYAINTSFWNLIYRPSYLKSLQTSVTMGLTLISGFVLYIQNTYIGDKINSTQEARFSFVAYMSAPIILILTSIISITILASNQDYKDISQFRILGASRKQLLKIRFFEALTHAVLIFLVSVIFNSVILFFVNYGANLLGHGITTLTGFWLPSMIILCLMITFYVLTKGYYIWKDS